MVYKKSCWNIIFLISFYCEELNISCPRNTIELLHNKKKMKPPPKKARLVDIENVDDLDMFLSQ